MLFRSDPCCATTWLRENIPALALRYTTVMRYKAAAKKLRQVVELPDPIPVAAVLDGAGAPEGAGAGNGAGAVDGTGAREGTEPKEGTRDYGAEKSQDNVRGRSRTRERLEARACRSWGSSGPRRSASSSRREPLLPRR